MIHALEEIGRQVLALCRVARGMGLLAWRVLVAALTFRLDGRELLRNMAKLGADSLPIVVLTARCDQEGLNQQTRTFDVKVYPKPFVPSKLVQEVDRMLEAVTP